MRLAKKSFSLEVLEARALFAGAALAMPDFDFVIQALSASGPIEAFPDPKIANRLVVLGSSEVDLTIDFNKLPSTLTSIDIQHFDNVTFEGAHVLYNLYLKDVRAVDAPQIDVLGGGLIAEDVEKLTINSVHGDLLMAGDKMDVKVDDLGATSVVLKLNSLVLETRSKSLSLVSMVNDRMVIALPITPSSWDPLNSSSWRGLSGFADISSQIRLNTRDVSIEAAQPDPGSPSVPGEPTPIIPPPPIAGSPTGSTGPIEPTTPATPPLTTEIDLRSYLDRLEIMFNSLGGFEATGLDISTVKQVVAELRQNQQDPRTVSAGDLIIPEVTRRAVLAETKAVHFEGHDIAPVDDAKTSVAVQIGELDVSFTHAGSVAQVNGEHAESPAILVDAPLRLPNGDGNSTAPSVHVTVDPEAPADGPQPGFLNVVSMLMDRAMDLKQYVINQLSQEVVPGERNGVLLVDPKSVRPSQQTKLSG